MASRGKKKTTMAKLNREARLRERRFDKQARKDARKRPPVDPPSAADPPAGDGNRSDARDLAPRVVRRRKGSSLEDSAGLAWRRSVPSLNATEAHRAEAGSLGR